MHDSLGDRMKKNYEDAYRITLPRRMPIIVRLDGKAFHSFTKNMKRPFADELTTTMAKTAEFLVQKVQTCVFAYIQSDEISLLLHNYKKLDTDPWFGNVVQKVSSVSASLATSFFNSFYINWDGNKYHYANFDSRVFVLPESEVVNYFIWRQKDAERNSIQMVAQSHFSHNMLYGKNINQQQDMIHVAGDNWNDYPTRHKRGIAVKNGNIDIEIPIFTQDRKYIEELLVTEE